MPRYLSSVAICVLSLFAAPAFAASVITKDIGIMPVDGIQHVLLTEDGRNVAVTTWQKGQPWRVFHNGKETDFTLTPEQYLTPALSPEGSRLAVTIQQGGPDRHATVVCDGTTWGPHAFVSDLVFSPDGKRLIFSANTGELDPRDGKTPLYTLFDNGKTIAQSPYGFGQFTFSPDGSHSAYTQSRSFNVFVVFDGKDGPNLHYDGNQIIYSPDSQHIAWTVGTDKGLVGVIDGKQLDDSVTCLPAFSANGMHLAYGITRTNGLNSYLLVDNVAIRVKRNVRQVFMSPDGKHQAWRQEEVIGRGLGGGDGLIETLRTWFVVDGKDWPAETGSGGGGNWGCFSPDSAHFACSVDFGGMQYDGIAQPHADLVGPPVFSANSKHWAYCARKDGKWTVLLDGATIAGPEPLHIQTGSPARDVPRCAFDADGSLHYVAVQDRRLLDVRCLP